MKKIILVPGYYISAPTEPGDWPDWLAQESKKYGFDFRLLALPDPAYPEVNAWVDYMLAQKIEVDKDTYFVGHSLGCITIARFLEKLPKEAVAGGCVFVSGFCTMPKIPILSDFCFLPLDYNEVKKHSRKFISVVSDNDHFIPNFLSQELSDKLGAQTVVEHHKGHFITGTKEIQSVLDVILELDKAQG